MDCHGGGAPDKPNGRGVIALVGHHNVGKSVVFHRLTGRRVMVSNYPGTTVEVARGAISGLPDTLLLDTPGILTFPSRSEDERATSKALLEEPLQAVLQVGDAKNLTRTLLLTLQLAELGVPLVLALNMADEAEGRGVRLDPSRLQADLSIPVIPTAAVHGEGLPELLGALASPSAPSVPVRYPEGVEAALRGLERRLPAAPVRARGLGLLCLCEDPPAEEWLAARLHPAERAELAAMRRELQAALGEPPAAAIQRAQLAAAESLAARALQNPGQAGRGLASALGRLAVHPVWGIPVLLGALAALYAFVGLFGAGTLVGLLEGDLFGRLLNPWIADTVAGLSPLPLLTELLVGRYGLWTMGITYAFALILPIVSTFFLAFGILEDSGYLPRLAVMSNRVFTRLGLNGKAVLPMVLGLGCVTMATLTTRILESRRERMLATLLLALAVPCSAQLGVVLGMLAGISLGATLAWALFVLGVLLAVGWLAARLLPGQRAPLVIELPPMRVPEAAYLIPKTLARVEWYLKEVVPLFLLGTALLFGLDKLGVLPWLIRAARPLVTGWLGLPPEASAALLIGFLRRDFGAAGFFAMQSAGLLDPRQVLVALVTLTLFIPCIAAATMVARERGWRTAAGMAAFVFPLAFTLGGLLNRLLLALGWTP
jgi:ferrous iron transport protein B